MKLLNLYKELFSQLWSNKIAVLNNNDPSISTFTFSLQIRWEMYCTIYNMPKYY